MKKAFSLIELLVVIAITAVLLAVALPNFVSARARARDTKKKQELNSMKQALQLYYNDFRRYPCGRYAPTCDVGFGMAMYGCGKEGNRNCLDGVKDADECPTADFASGGTDGCTNVYMKRLPVITSGYKYYMKDPNGVTSTDNFLLCVDTLENTADPDIATSNTRCGGAGSPRYCVCAD